MDGDADKPLFFRLDRVIAPIAVRCVRVVRASVLPVRLKKSLNLWNHMVAKMVETLPVRTERTPVRVIVASGNHRWQF